VIAVVHAEGARRAGRLNAAFPPVPGAQDKMLGLDKSGLD
jgi:hypothetical protein